MPKNQSFTRATLKTPKAAAIAGVVFSVLLITIIWLLRNSIPYDPLEPGKWLATNAKTAALALNLIPFAGVAFLWFIGALRDRLGQLEDRFFATVFFGSALLFLAMVFGAAAALGPGRDVQLRRISDRARHGLHHHECICDQNGGRIHDLDIDGHYLHSHCTALDRNSWLCASDNFVVRELLHELELRGAARLGAPDQLLHAGG